MLILETPKYSNYTLNPNDFKVRLHIRPAGKSDLISVGIMVAYMIFILIVTSSVAFRTRKIRHNNFKDTKKINIFISLTIVASFFLYTFHVVLTEMNYEPIANIILIMAQFALPTLCQFILFTPKVVPVLLEKLKHSISFSSFTKLPSWSSRN